MCLLKGREIFCVNVVDLPLFSVLFLCLFPLSFSFLFLPNIGMFVAAGRRLSRGLSLRSFHLSGSAAYSDREVRADARRGRDGAEMVLDMMTHEFKKERASALGKSGEKIEEALAELAAAGDAVARLDSGARKLAGIQAYNKLWKRASAARQNLVIQREAARSAAGNAGVMRVDVIKGSMSDGPGESADDVVRKQYPLPQRMDKHGRFVALASEVFD